MAYGYDEVFYVHLDTDDYINYGIDDHGLLFEKRRGPKFFDTDVDEEMKIRRAQDLLREADLTRRLASAQLQANIDSMTGVRNKHAYLEYVNDNLGHQAGDQWIREACRIVCTSFKRSPVFRVGGDEFCVISQGDDYENLNDLVQIIR